MPGRQDSQFSQADELPYTELAGEAESLLDDNLSYSLHLYVSSGSSWNKDYMVTLRTRSTVSDCLLALSKQPMPVIVAQIMNSIINAIDLIWKNVINVSCLVDSPSPCYLQFYDYKTGLKPKNNCFLTVFNKKT